MKIGLDLDGVVINSEELFRVYEEIYDINYLKGNNKVNIEEPKAQTRYNWNDEEFQKFKETFFKVVSIENDLMPGFKVVYNLLKKLDIEFIVITARGKLLEEMRDDAVNLFKEHNIEFDKYFWAVENKTEICKKEKIDIMIDDDYSIIEELANHGFKTLYFRNANLKKIENNKYVHEVNNWGDIYRKIIELYSKKQF